MSDDDNFMEGGYAEQEGLEESTPSNKARSVKPRKMSPMKLTLLIVGGFFGVVILSAGIFVMLGGGGEPMPQMQPSAPYTGEIQRQTPPQAPVAMHVQPGLPSPGVPQPQAGMTPAQGVHPVAVQGYAPPQAPSGYPPQGVAPFPVPQPQVAAPAPALDGNTFPDFELDSSGGAIRAPVPAVNPPVAPPGSISDAVSGAADIRPSVGEIAALREDMTLRLSAMQQQLNDIVGRVRGDDSKVAAALFKEKETLDAEFKKLTAKYEESARANSELRKDNDRLRKRVKELEDKLGALAKRPPLPGWDVVGASSRTVAFYNNGQTKFVDVGGEIFGVRVEKVDLVSRVVRTSAGDIPIQSR